MAEQEYSIAMSAAAIAPPASQPASQILLLRTRRLLLLASSVLRSHHQSTIIIVAVETRSASTRSCESNEAVNQSCCCCCCVVDTSARSCLQGWRMNIIRTVAAPTWYCNHTVAVYYGSSSCSSFISCHASSNDACIAISLFGCFSR